MKQILIAILISIVFYGCKKESSPGANAVWMQNNMFNPSSITVSVNSTVTWTNKDNVTHNVTSSNSAFTSSGNIGAGGTYSYKFTATGTYPYSCTIHSGMNGTVIVQ